MQADPLRSRRRATGSTCRKRTSSYGAGDSGKAHICCRSLLRIDFDFAGVAAGGESHSLRLELASAAQPTRRPGCSGDLTPAATLVGAGHHECVVFQGQVGRRDLELIGERAAGVRHQNADVGWIDPEDRPREHVAQRKGLLMTDGKRQAAVFIDIADRRTDLHRVNDHTARADLLAGDVCRRSERVGHPDGVAPAPVEADAVRSFGPRRNCATLQGGVDGDDFRKILIRI